MELEDLRTAIAALDISSKEDASEVYTTQSQLPPGYINRLVPVDILCYAVRNTSHPSILRRRIPKLIILLCSIEKWRQMLVIEAQELLSQSHKGNPILQPHADAKRSVACRQIYRFLIFDLCKLHLHQLFPTSDINALFNELRDLYPSVNENLSADSHNKRSPTPFYADFSAEELAELDIERFQAKELLKVYFDWDMKRRQEDPESPGKANPEAFRADFEDHFPPPMTNEKLTKEVALYLKLVEQMDREVRDAIGE